MLIRNCMPLAFQGFPKEGISDRSGAVNGQKFNDCGRYLRVE